MVFWSRQVNVGASLHLQNEGVLSLEDNGDLFLAFRNKGLILDPGDVDLHIITLHNCRGVGEMLISTSLSRPDTVFQHAVIVDS